MYRHSYLKLVELPLGKVLYESGAFCVTSIFRSTRSSRFYTV
jgi:hypothetical protein